MNKLTVSGNSDELREERQLRQVRARIQLRAARAAEKEQKTFLATHQAAERGRRNKDWRASGASADQAIIPDASLLNARSRQCIRDSWIGKAAVRAFSRNVVGCGILPIPMAKDADGNLLPKVNKKLLKLFWSWANNREFCDIEKRQTFWQKQNLLVEERVAVGEGFLIWSYVPDPRAVGLKLQSFEAEQLDLRMQSFHDAETGQNNQVRGGIEVDVNGAPVAYHFYTRNPVDYLIASYRSIRILASRVIHYFKQERVLQTRGVTPLAPILQEVRDFNRYRDATLWRAIMEACIGMVIKKDALGGASPFGIAAAPADPGQTASGMRTIDFTPGMVPELNPGESVDPYIPSSPGNQYDPYIKTTMRGIGAGIGLSGSQITRQSESNYSAARQDMLEDRKEFEPEQEMMAHNVLLNPLWPIFVRLAVLEGRLDGILETRDFEQDPDRYCEAEYVAPAAPWIDPSNEANAYEKLIQLKVMDREEVAALRGKRLADIWDKIEAEQRDAEAKRITLPENKDDLAFKRDTIKNLIADGASQIVANGIGIPDLIEQAGLPVRDGYVAPYLPVVAAQGPLVSGETLENEAGEIVGGDVVEPPPPPATIMPPGLPGDPTKPAFPQLNASDPAKNDENTGKIEENTSKTSDLASKKSPRGLPVLDQKTAENSPKQPPGYKNGDETIACGTCSYFFNGNCNKFAVPVEAEMVCDAWDAKPVGKDDESGVKKAFPPFPVDGSPPIDHIKSDFTENPAYGN